MASVDRLLEPRTRMVSFLGCLALSMIFGAVILRWFEPADTTARMRQLRGSSPEQVAIVALDTLTPIAAGRWSSIAIEPLHASGPGRLAGTRTLAALPERTDCHFVVDAAGHVAATQAWRSQLSADGLPDRDAIRILFIDTEVAGAMDSTQWPPLAHLIKTLRASCRIPGRGISVGTDDPGDTPATQARRAELESLLDRAGLKD